MPKKKFMSLDEYLAYKADSTRNAAYEKSMARNKGIEIIYPLTKERKEKNERTIAQFLSGTKQPDSVKQRAEANYVQALKELENNCEYGLNCIGTGLDNYPIDSRSHVNKDFANRHNSLGFKEIELKDALPGDIVQAVNERGPFHGMIFAGWDDKGRPTFNYSSGGIEPGHYVKQGIYNVPYYYVYRYEGTPELKQQWTNEYNNTNQKKLGGMKVNRQKKFLGAVLGAVGSIASSAIQAQNQKAIFEEQQRQQRVAQNQANFNTYLQNVSELANTDNSWAYDKFKPAFKCGGTKRMKAELGKYKARFDK